MHPHFLKGLAVVPLLFSTATFAAAEPHATAHAAVSNVHYVLRDLNPGDGITPYLTYQYSNIGLAQASAGVEHAGLKGIIFAAGRASNSPWDYGSFSKTLVTPTHLKSGTMFGQGLIQGNSLDTLKLAAIATIRGTQGGSYATVASAGFQPTYFYLSPNTELSITYDLTVSSSLEGGSGYDGANASASFSLSDDSWEVQHTLSADGPWASIGLPGTQTFTSLVESGAKERKLYITVDAYTRVQLTTPVPEPERWAMMLAGLGGLGMAARRRAAAPHRNA